MARIFISHSCKDRLLDDPQVSLDPALQGRLEMVRRVRDATVDLLQKNGHTTLFDQQDLKGGDVWRGQLRAWLGLCDGAVIFLTEDSAKSHWLRYEAAILTWRMWSNKSLKVVPVLLGVAPEKLDELGFEPHQIKELQAHNVPPAQLALLEAAEPGEAEALAAELAALFVSGCSSTSGKKDPVHLWAKRVVTLLKACNSDCIIPALDELKVPPSEQADESGRLEVLAHYLMQAETDNLNAALKELEPGYAEYSLWQRLARELLPAWVEPQAARSLARVLPEEAAIALAYLLELKNPKKWILQDYVHCALGRTDPGRLFAFGLTDAESQSWEYAKLPPVGEDVGEFVDKLEEGLRKRLLFDDFGNANSSANTDANSEQEGLKKLNKYLTYEPFFVGVSAEMLAHPEAVAQTRQRLHGARFVFCGVPPPSPEPPADAERLLPPVSDEVLDDAGLLRSLYYPKS